MDSGTFHRTCYATLKHQSFPRPLSPIGGYQEPTTPGGYPGQTDSFHLVFTRFRSPGSWGIHLFSRLRYTIRGLSVSLSRLCLATFEQLLAFGTTFCGTSNLEQILPFWATFEQNIGLEHKSSTKKSTISYKTLIYANFLNVYQFFNFFFLT